MNMKKFWNNIIVDKVKSYSKEKGYNQAFNNGYGRAIYEIKEAQFDFFWERGAKEYVEICIRLYPKSLCYQTNFLIENANGSNNGQDFLDCIGIDKERVKEEIKKIGDSK